MKEIGNTTEEDFDNTYRLNVKGPYFLVQVRDARSEEMFEADIKRAPESVATLGFRLAYCTAVNHTLSCIDSDAQLPALLFHQRRH